jgi:hypothetical protein
MVVTKACFDPKEKQVNINDHFFLHGIDFYTLISKHDLSLDCRFLLLFVFPPITALVVFVA